MMAAAVIAAALAIVAGRRRVRRQRYAVTPASSSAGNGDHPVMSPRNGRDEQAGDGAEGEAEPLVAAALRQGRERQPADGYNNCHRQPHACHAGAVRVPGYRAEQAFVLARLNGADPAGFQESPVPVEEPEPAGATTNPMATVAAKAAAAMAAAR